MALSFYLEQLESRTLLSAGDPSAREQYLLELINRARVNPAAELPLLIHSSDPDVNTALSFFHVDLNLLMTQWSALTAEPPLAWNNDLATAALGHSQQMLAFDQQEHQLPGEPDLGTRITDAGYDFSDAGENIFAFGTSVFQTD